MVNLRSVLMMICFVSVSVCKAQTGTWVYPMTIHVQDSSFKELSYFKYNTVTNTVTTRGTMKYTFQFFTNVIFIPLIDRETALRKIKDQLNNDGTIRCISCLTEALRKWDSIIIKQNIPE